jgi:hypothetical protein
MIVASLPEILPLLDKHRDQKARFLCPEFHSIWATAPRALLQASAQSHLEKQSFFNSGWTCT